MKTLKLLEFFACLSSACWLAKWGALFSSFVPPSGRQFLWNFYFTMKKTLSCLYLQIYLNPLSSSPVSLDVMTTCLLSVHSSVFSLGRLALGSSGALLHQVFPESWSFILPTHVNTSNSFLSWLLKTMFSWYPCSLLSFLC